MVEERVKRRLAANVGADNDRYARLMGADVENTLAALKAHRRELIDPLIDQHRGRIFKTTGDGMLIEFASVVDAVRCAVVVQRGMEDRTANLPESERIRLRIGITHDGCRRRPGATERNTTHCSSRPVRAPPASSPRPGPLAIIEAEPA